MYTVNIFLKIHPLEQDLHVVSENKVNYTQWKMQFSFNFMTYFHTGPEM